MQINSYFLLLIFTMFSYPLSCMAQNSKPDNLHLTKASIAKYLKKANKDPMTAILKSYEVSGYNYLVPYHLSLQCKVDSADNALNFARKSMLTTFSSFAGDVKDNETYYINEMHKEKITL